MKIENIAAKRVIRGIGVSPGIAIGPVYVFDRGRARVPAYGIAAKDVEKEIARFDAAVTRVEESLERLQRKAARFSGASEEEFGLLLEAHMQMLGNSRLMRRVRELIRERQINAEAAIDAAIEDIARDFARIADAYLAARIVDIREVGARLIHALASKTGDDFSHAPKGAVLVGETVSPADVALMVEGRVAGLVAQQGGAESHTAIMARALGIPAVLGIAGISAYVDNNQRIIVDGNNGQVIIAPDKDTETAYRAKQRRFTNLRRELTQQVQEKSITQDGTKISLSANIELPVELPMVLEAGADGIGLMRSEFMFMNRPSPPSEDEQYHILADIVKTLNGKPITVRTLDAGAEKMPELLPSGGDGAANPALGLRGIRLSLREKKLFRSQIAAMLRAATHGPLSILLPMVASHEEIRAAKSAIKATARSLRRRGVTISDKLPPIGIMIEVPAAALIADMLAHEADFFSIGTNDLTMYALALDRGNEQVAGLYDPLHPAVLRLVQFTAAAAGQAGIPVTLCGEMAGDAKMLPLLLGLGLRSLSATPLAISAVKQRLRQSNIAECEALARKLMAEPDRHRREVILTT